MQTDYDARRLLQRYKGKCAKIDTNVLLLYLVGSYDPEMVERFKKTHCHFDRNDFLLIKRVASLFSSLIVLPNTLTETSNLFSQLDQRRREGVMSLLTAHIKIWSERYIPSLDAATWKHFPKFGLTDSCIALLANTEHLVITNDLPLWSLLRGLGVATLNFSHLRTWFGDKDFTAKSPA